MYQRHPAMALLFREVTSDMMLHHVAHGCVF
jgi:hypothetical protein